MTPSQLAYLKEHEERLAVVLLRHCLNLLSIRYGLTEFTMLPRGKRPQDIVLDVLEKYQTGERKFTDEHPIDAQLKEGVRSWLSSLFKSSDGRWESINESENYEHASAAAHSDSPDKQVENSHDLEVLYRMLNDAPEVRKNAALQALVQAMKGGAEDVVSQASATGVGVKRVYELRKSLKPIARRVLKQFNALQNVCQ